ncbi:uncharacterized protein LOC110713390 isoform X3 [Chenopodium quinoa]|uniref:uncharacterized protein LOC110713390 isoform X3 n=1 Tax=Chenopodium quinoa TaxID=63459 RepID=UPI000B77B1E3|nr:uncharacterized protein LOC110713390 isoform X3 [Chenopodium quinoa]
MLKHCITHRSILVYNGVMSLQWLQMKFLIEPNEPESARNEKQDRVNIQSGLINIGNAGNQPCTESVGRINVEANNTQVDGQDIGRPLSDQCMLYQKSTNHPRTRKHKQAIASMSEPPTPIRLILKFPYHGSSYCSFSKAGDETTYC